jgi:hypothetical protein
LNANVTYSDADVCSFLEALSELPDGRDNRGKRHALPFVVVALVLAILSGRSKVSSLFRYIRNRIDWLREMTHQPEAQAISRAHLPRLLARLDWNGNFSKTPGEQYYWGSTFSLQRPGAHNRRVVKRR